MEKVTGNVDFGGDKMEEVRFRQKCVGFGGPVNRPEPIWEGPYMCKVCNVPAVIEKKESISTQETGYRGTLKRSYTKVHLRCPKCGGVGTAAGDYNEKDVTYHSNEEIGVYGDTI